MIVKVSGEALSGPDGFGIHQPTVDRIAEDLVAARRLGVELGVVVGGGNIFRGVKMSEQEPVAADRRPDGHAGHRDERAGARGRDRAAPARPARTMSALSDAAGLRDLRAPARAAASRARTASCVFAGGTGNPFFTTDTTAVLRAAEIGLRRRC